MANSYLKKLNTDNQQQDFKQALDAKFKAIDKQTDQLIHELKKRISLGLSLAQVMVQASLVYLAYKQYKLSKDY